MVLLVKIQESAIVENLKKRFFDDLIYVSSKKVKCCEIVGKNRVGKVIINVSYNLLFTSSLAC